MENVELQRCAEEDAVPFGHTDRNDPYYMDQQMPMMESDQCSSGQNIREQEASSIQKDFGNEHNDGNRVVEKDNTHTAEGNLQRENVSQQSGNAANQKQGNQEKEAELLSEEDEYDMVLREEANDAASLQMKIRLEAEKMIMMDVKIEDAKECAKRDLLKTNKLIKDLKLKKEEMDKYVNAQTTMAQTIRYREELQATEMKNNLHLFEILNKSLSESSKKRSVLESKKSDWQKQLDKWDVFRKKADQLTQTIDSEKSRLSKIHEKYVESNIYFADRSTKLQNELDHLSSQLSDYGAERKRRECRIANKKAHLDEQKQKLVDNKEKTASIKTEMNQLKNDVEKLAEQRLHQKKMYRDKLNEISEASTSVKQRMDCLTNQNIKMKEEADAAEIEIKEIQTRLQSLKTQYSGLKQEHEQRVVSEKDITKKMKQEEGELHNQLSCLDQKEIELQASLANIHEDKENLNTVLHELTKKNDYLATTQDQISKSEVELRKSVNLLKLQLHDLQSKCEPFDNESLRILLTTEIEDVKRSQAKMDEQDLRNKSDITEAENKLEQKRVACEKEIQARIVSKDAHLQGMKDSVVKTRCQNERELEKLKSHLDSLRTQESDLRTRCEDLNTKVSQERRKQEEICRRKKRMEKLNLICSPQVNVPKPLPALRKSTGDQNKPQQQIKRVKFDLESSLESSSDERPDCDPTEQRRLFQQIIQSFKN